MTEVLLEKRPDGVALITLNQPEKLNPVGGDFADHLAPLLRDCELDPDVGCVALTGAGRAFSAGGDMSRRNASGKMEPPPVSTLNVRAQELWEQTETTCGKLRTMLKPTVAIVNGFAMGAGMSFALACDIRLCSANAKFGTAFRNMGYSGDYGMTYLLVQCVGSARARELLFTAEPFDAQRALELGIATRVYDEDDWFERALDFCARLAAGPRGAYGRMKENLFAAEKGDMHHAFHLEATNQRISGVSQDNREAVAAFVEKRDPRFPPFKGL